VFEAVVDKGLVLRLLEPRHAQALFDLIERSRDHLGYWFPWVEETRAVEASRAFIQESLEQFARGDGFQLGIWLDSELIGIIGLQSISHPFRSTELYYWLGAEYEGRGVMTKVCRYLCSYLFVELNLNRIEIRCAETNTKSRAIPERLGFSQEGKLRQMGYTRAGPVDYLIYSLLADEWQRETR
jgi:ribosomal-protein-serine acetyltransferase